MSKATVAVECDLCKAAFEEGEEVYYHLGLYEFDVDRARALVQDGREPVEVEEESVEHSVDGCKINPAHVDHVDAGLPGIIAHLEYVTKEGERLKGHVLIDGHHRAARCLKEKKPFFAYLLTEQESQSILNRWPIKGEEALRSGYRPGPQLQPAES